MAAVRTGRDWPAGRCGADWSTIGQTGLAWPGTGGPAWWGCVQREEEINRPGVSLRGKRILFTMLRQGTQLYRYQTVLLLMLRLPML